MDKKDLIQKLEGFDPSQLIRWLAWIFTGAIAAIMTVFLFYFMNFDGELSKSHERWGTFGDFIGGTLNPILSFLALIALILMVILQKRQLEISSEELKATREELRRSAEAHEKSEKSLQLQARALEISARISAMSHLLNQADDTLRSITSYESGSPQEAQKNIAAKNKMELILELKKLYEELKLFDDSQP